jgi:pantoate--beta-alanine ligase
VVKKFFDIVQPHRAYFGKKDFQQLAVITHMVKTLGLPVGIVPCETIREADGLAMSSRNMRLTIAERNLAPKIYELLMKVKEKAGKIPVTQLKDWALKNLGATPGFRVEYFEIGERAVAFVAVFLGDVRLIDNVELFL